MNNLATIQKIKNVRHHPNADSLDLAQVLGWQVVVKRDEFKEDDLVIYVVIDTVLPETPTFEFLRNKHFRIKPIRLRGEESAGICFPLTILPTAFRTLDDGSPMTLIEGMDVTDELDIKKYEKPIPAQLAGQAVGGFPGFLIITDELNLRTYPVALEELYSRPYYITTKMDGSSGTFFHKDETFGVCSRRINLKESETNGFWKIAKKYDLKNVLEKAFPGMNIAIQSEIFGVGIQGNPCGIDGIDMKVFNLFDIDTRCYFGYNKMMTFCQEFNIPMVDVVNEGNIFHYKLEELIKLANEVKYSNGAIGEGIVCRPKEPFYSTILKKSWSGKIISENYKE
jgi:RNA ligase (TIGR02306 family)